nr:hypothetical protein [Tanacetum cinerariifolium]
MMTVRKRVGPLPILQLDVGHPVNHSSSNYFSPNNSARDSSLDSSSKASSDFHSDLLSNSSSRHSLSNHPSPDLPSTSVRPSHKRRRFPMTYVPALSPVFRALSLVRTDLIPSPNRVRDSGYLAYIDVDLRETSLRDDVIVRGSNEPHLEQDIDLDIQAEIDECIAYTNDLRDKGIDARVLVEVVDREEKLDYHLEEVYKATTDHLDWVNLEGQQYPHNLLQPLPLIPDNRGRRVIPFEHFINNDLEYLRGGASSRKYTTSITKTKVADYGHIKWIEDLVPHEMWIQQPIDYNK